MLGGSPSLGSAALQPLGPASTPARCQSQSKIIRAAQRLCGSGVMAGMSFFKTRDRQRDRSIDEAARLVRRQQQQRQHQILAQLQTLNPPLQPLA